jgi:threonine/homoserine/homoserine lactone efflux protein
MIDGSAFATYLAVITVLMVTPGPDMLLVLATGMAGGPRAGVVTALGVASGEVVHITAAALGLAAIFRAAPALYDAVRIAGACYLIWLGVQALRAHRLPVGRDGGRPVSPWRAYRRGVLTNLLNPKMALFTLALLPQFIDPGRGQVGLQFLVLGVSFIVIEIAVDGSVGYAAGRLRRLLARGRLARALQVISGSIYLGLGARLAVSR